MNSIGMQFWDRFAPGQETQLEDDMIKKEFWTTLVKLKCGAQENDGISLGMTYWTEFRRAADFNAER